MKSAAPARPPLPARLATALALLLLAWTLAWWTWALLAPTPDGRGAVVGAPALMGKVLAERVADRHLFGRAAEATAPGAEVFARAPASLELRGLYAPRDGRGGFAIIAVDGQSLPALTGQTFAPGMTLERVHADHVLIRRGAALEKLLFAGALDGPDAARAQAGASGGLTVHRLGDGQYGLSRSELSALLGDPARMTELGRFAPHPQGGVVLEQSPPASLPDKLGMGVGDILLDIDGRDLRTSVDAGRVFNHFTTGERVKFTIRRGGETLTQTIQVYP